MSTLLSRQKVGRGVRAANGGICAWVNETCAKPARARLGVPRNRWGPRQVLAVIVGVPVGEWAGFRTPKGEFWCHLYGVKIKKNANIMAVYSNFILKKYQISNILGF